MKKLLIISLWGIFGILAAVNFTVGEGNNTEIVSRDSLAYYHNNTDDLHWYGAESWAVFFDFNNYFDSIDSLEFEATGAYIYIPNELPDDELTVRLCENNINQPGELLESQTINPVLGWNEITFSHSYTDTIFWLIADYPTNSVDQFIAASAIDGTHSYYRQDDYYFNLAASGFVSEFLFSLKGNFLIERDIELVDFHLQIDENYYPDGSLNFDAYPVFTVRNNSNIIFTNCYLALSITYPLWTITDTIYISSISAHEELTMNYFQNPLYKYDLLRRYSQYNIDARLVHELGFDDLPDNNEKNYYLNIFPYEPENIFVENFLKLGVYNNEIWSEEAEILNPDSCEILNYFSDISDSLYCPDALERFIDYNLSGYPSVIVGGEKKIIGYNNNFVDSLCSYTNSFFSTNNNFVLETSRFATVNPSLNVNFSFTLKNEKTYIFTDYLEECRLYVAIAEENVQLRENVFGSILLNIIYDEENPQLNCEDSLTVTVEFNELYNVDPINNLANCKLIYWLQNMETGKIEFLNSIPFGDFTFTEANETEQAFEDIRLEMFPNPFSPNNSLKLNLSYSQAFDSGKLEIFNIKGQLVKSLNIENSSNSFLVWDGTDSKNKLVGSGIYFLRIQLKRRNTVKSYLRNCIFIR